MDYLRRPEMFPAASQLLLHLFTLFRRYYLNNLDEASAWKLMGAHPDDIALELHAWATRVDLNALLELPGTAHLLFETELIAKHVGPEVADSVLFVSFLSPT